MTDEKNNNHRAQSSMTSIPDPEIIREQAEQKARAIGLPDLDTMTHEEIRQIIYEMQVKQIESNLQIEHLRSGLEEKDDQASLFSIVTENMLDMIALTDMEGNFLFAGKSHAILGYEPGFLIGKNVMDFLDPLDLPYILEEFAEFVASVQPRKVEYRYRCEDGSYLWLETWGNFITDAKGIPQKIVFSSRDITERKRAEDALIESEALFRGMFKDHSAVMLLIDPCTGQIIKANHAATQYYGYSPEKILQMKIQQLNILPPAAVKKEMRSALNKQLNIFEFQHMLADGQVRDVEVHSTPITIQHQTLLFSIIRDITEHKRAEGALRESKEILSRAQEISHTGSWKLDLTANRLTWSDEVYRIFGCKPQEFSVTYEAFLDFVYRDDRAAVDAAYSRSLREGNDSYEIEYRIIRRNSGEVRHVHELCVHERDDAGAIIQSIGMVQDITERKQAKTYREMGREILQILNEPGDLQESIQRVLATLKTRTGIDAVGLRLQEGEDFPYFVQDGFSKDFLLTENTLIERDKDGGVCRDKDGNARLECTCGLVISGKTDPSNPLFTQGGSCWTNDSFPLLDLPSDQDPRRHPRNNCIHQGYASVALIPIRIQEQMYSRETCIRHGFSSMAQVPVRTRDRIEGLIQLNDKRKGRFSLETIEILEGIAAHIGSTLMRKRAEAEQEKLQAQLNQAQKMESVGRLAGGVAHDFNNKLTIINSYSEMAIDMLDPSDPVRDTIHEVHTAAQQSADIVRQLLAFARKQIISPEPLDLNDTLSAMLKMLQRLIGENIDLAWHPGKNLWPVKIDLSQVDQIMANLAVNARDAISDVGKLTIETKNAVIDEDYCKTNPDVMPGRYVMLAVSDDGCGMEKDVMGQLFEPYFTTKDVGKGTGLGLPTIYGIIKQNKGFVNVFSEHGEGTTFEIYLPSHEGEITAVHAAEEFSRNIPGGTETILIVEDEKALLQATRRILERQGYIVLIAESPGEALTYCNEYDGTIDLLLTDVVMPDMNGRDLASQMTMIRPGLKTLYMSGYTANSIAHHGVLDEGVLFIQKPFSMQDLAAKVRDAIAQE